VGGRHFSLVAATALACGMAPAWQGSSKTPVGFVQDLHGPWVDDANGGKPLTQYAKVFAESRIRVTRTRTDYHIFIRIYGLAEVQPFDCDHATVCPGPIDLKEALDRRSQPLLASFRRVIGALMGIFSEAPPGGDSFFARGAGEQGAEDDLATTGTGYTKVDRLFSRLPFGEYEVRFRPLVGTVPPSIASMEWNGTPKVPLTLQPGLYDVELRRPPGSDAAPKLETAVVLVVKERDFAGARALLDEGRRYVETWKDPGDGEAHAVMRYLMLSIARLGDSRK
jgi:hypothetical protein